MYTPDEDMNAAPTDFSNDDIIRQSSLEVGESYAFRVVGMMIPYRQLWYDASVENRDSGAIEQRKRMLRLPFDLSKYNFKKEPTVVDDLIKIDLQIKKKHRPVNSKEAVESYFKPRDMYIYPVIDRRDPEPVIKLLRVFSQSAVPTAPSLNNISLANPSV